MLGRFGFLWQKIIGFMRLFDWNKKSCHVKKKDISLVEMHVCGSEAPGNHNQPPNSNQSCHAKPTNNNNNKTFLVFHNRRGGKKLNQHSKIILETLSAKELWEDGYIDAYWRIWDCIYASSHLPCLHGPSPSPSPTSTITSLRSWENVQADGHCHDSPHCMPVQCSQHATTCSRADAKSITLTVFYPKRNHYSGLALAQHLVDCTFFSRKHFHALWSFCATREAASVEVIEYQTLHASV